MGFKLANRAPIDCERTCSEKPFRLSRDVKASKGILMRDMVELTQGDSQSCELFEGSEFLWKMYVLPTFPVS